MELIRWFPDLTQADLPLAGGKGANLGEMARAGLPVPPGFVLLTPAYEAFVAMGGLQAATVQAAEQATTDGSAGAFEAASETIRALFDRGQVPPAVAEAVISAYRQLCSGEPMLSVAVRSSATAEDLPGASFAGQQDTYLNITGEAAVLAAVQRCWASLWTARALAYRARQRIRPEAVTLAVVVQRLIPAEAAGVLFTANPVTGGRDQMVIDGAWGLGESVVSGQVTPDHWVADGATGRVLEARIARKEQMTARTELGTVTLPVPPEQQERPVLDEAGVAALVALGRQTAAHFGSPQDLEWALADGAFYLVQSRPITSLFPDLAPPPAPELGLRVHFSLNILQGIVEPFTPAGIDGFHQIALGAGMALGYHLEGRMKSPVLREAAGRCYADITGALRHPRLRVAISAVPAIIDQPTSQILKAYLAREPERTAPNATGMPIHPPLRLILPAVGRMLLSLLFPDFSRDRTLARVEAITREVERQAAELQGSDARLRFVVAGIRRLMPTILIPNMIPMLGPGMGMRFILEKKLKAWLGDAALLQKVLRALPHNPTTEMDLALWQLSRTLLVEGAEPRADHPAVQAFLGKYGHRAIREIDFGMPRWREDPTHLLNVLRTYLTHGEEADPEAQFRRGIAEAEAAAAEIVAQVRRKQGPVKAWAARFMLRRIRALVGTREYPKFYAIRMLAAMRVALKGIGAELAAAGRIETAEDVFFLRFADLAAPGDLRSLVDANRAEYERECGRKAIPRVITSEGEAFYAAPVTVAGALMGTAASPGCYEGVVRVILDPRGAKLEPGEVLVAPGTDPAWTPLFLTAGALVMEVGGIMSHGSVVAREYGIPAVVGVAGATRDLVTGQRVRVDGETGQVVPL